MNSLSYKVSKHGTCLIQQGTAKNVKTKVINRLVQCGDKMLHQVTQATFLCTCSREDISKEESSVNMKIFIGLKDLQAELPGLTKLDFSLARNSHAITNLVYVRAVVTRIQTYYQAKALYFRKRGTQKMYICQQRILLIINKMRAICKQKRAKGK